MSAVRGDLVPGDLVWLIPRTLAAPPICYGQPRAVMVRFDGLHVVVKVDGREYRIHGDNVQRSDPHKAKPHARPVYRRPELPDGWEEPPLW